MRPRPPPSEAPPTITAAIAVSSYPSAAWGVALAVWPIRMMPDTRRAGGHQHVNREAHPPRIDPHLGRGSGIAADGIDVVAETGSVKDEAKQQRDDCRKRIAGIGNRQETAQTRAS